MTDQSESPISKTRRRREEREARRVARAARNAEIERVARNDAARDRRAGPKTKAARERELSKFIARSVGLDRITRASVRQPRCKSNGFAPNSGSNGMNSFYEPHTFANRFKLSFHDPVR
jgi:hypothetical protein